MGISGMWHTWKSYYLKLERFELENENIDHQSKRLIFNLIANWKTFKSKALLVCFFIFQLNFLQLLLSPFIKLGFCHFISKSAAVIQVARGKVEWRKLMITNIIG